MEVGVVPEVQLLQVPQLTEGPSFNPRDVVGEQPQNLIQRKIQRLNGDYFSPFSGYDFTSDVKKFKACSN